METERKHKHKYAKGTKNMFAKIKHALGAPCSWLKKPIS